MYGSPPRMRGKVDKHDPKRGQHRITPAYAGKSLYVGLNFAQTEGSPPRMRGKVIKCTWGWYVPMDHPRVCGEKVCFSFRPTAFLGSPPRMRGKGFYAVSGRFRPWITPAYAGKRDVTARSAGAAQDHPRVCGEKAEWFRANRYYEGSPPRMRGKVGLPPPFLSMRRITPAYAGKSPKFRNRLDVYKDHPRVCGEKTYRDSPTYPAAGSPPRMRGKASGPGVLSSLSGITPAYAGKSPVRELLLIVSRDHPRVCGEKLAGRCPAPAGLGSPPRMRGKVSRLRYLSRHSRITPAYAGKRILRRLRQISPLDHPRVCGEKCVGSGGQCGAAGSPPRMRGKGTMERKKQSPDRITPAYAGKSPVRVADYRAGEDHPRVCGEKDLELSAETVGLGSPPRMRGKVNLTK